MSAVTLKKIPSTLKRYFCTKPTKWPRQIFSAIQPSGEVHLGNYLGAIKKWVHLQDTEKNKVFFSIADLHAITTPRDSKELQKNIFQMAATLFACGIDTRKSIIFQQSMVPEHAELNWILGTMTTLARLSHLPQYKEKCQLVKEPPLGIFLYPVLQAADIMLYRTTHVPVGEDQIMQIELANHLIKLFNNRYGITFPEANTIIDSTYSRVKSLLDPAKKMSKSDLNQKSVISLTDDPNEIVRKCRKALADFKSEITYEPEERPAISNLILIHSGLTGESPENIVKESKNLNTGQYKLVLADVIVEHLKPIREKIFEYMNSREFLISELKKGAEKAHEIAAKTLKEVKEKVGLDLHSFRISELKAHNKSERQISSI